MNQADDIALQMLQMAKEQIASAERRSEEHMSKLIGKWAIKIGVGLAGLLVSGMGLVIKFTWNASETLTKVNNTLTADRESLERHERRIDEIPGVRDIALKAQSTAEKVDIKLDAHLQGVKESNATARR